MKKVLLAIISVFLFSSLHAQNKDLPKLKPLKEKYLVGTLVPVEKKGKWGYGIMNEGDKKPKVVIKELFEEARGFVNNVAIIKYNGKYGLLDRTGMLILDPEYDEFRDFDSGIAYARNQNTHYKFSDDAKEVCKWQTLDTGEKAFTYKGITFNLKPIAPGKFNMGGNGKHPELDYDSPVHEVNITKPYHIGEAEVTQNLWSAIMNNASPSKTKGDTLPVENISWDDCQEFIKKLSELFNTEFRLPTEAEWEYAARGGNSYSDFSGSNTLGEVGWYNDNGICLQEVKKKTPNKYGLYDMSGNVAEWCSDWYNSFYYKECPYNDPAGPSTGKGRVVRGGDWKSINLFARVYCRTSHAPSYKSEGLGLRLAMSDK